METTAPKKHSYSSKDTASIGFKAYDISEYSNKNPHYGRRDLCKICLVYGKQYLNFGTNSIKTNGYYFFFGNPNQPYSTQLIEGNLNGFACSFSKDFLNLKDCPDNLRESALFKVGVAPIIEIDESKYYFFSVLFERMINEQYSNYIFKDDILRSYITLIMQEAQKIAPNDHLINPVNAASRLAHLFLDLLERQFPIENSSQRITYRHANDFANHLAVHVNYLNRAVKQTIGKTTSTIIAERLLQEAKALLLYSDLSISEIAYVLGFEYVSYFTKFFKKATGLIPKNYRSEFHI